MIHIVVPSIPISVNHAYQTIRRRVGKKSVTQRVLTQEGKAYKNETKSYIARHFSSELKFFKPNLPYDLLIELTFKGRDTLVSKTWPENAESRYKRLDVSNRVKLFEDALASATGLDDNHNWFVGVGKAWHQNVEETNVWVWCRETERSPLYELVRELKGARPRSP